MADQAEFCFHETVEYEKEAAAKFLNPEALTILQTLMEQIGRRKDLGEKGLESMFRELAEKMGVKLVKVAQPVRVALTGSSASPGLFEVMDILGKGEVLRRLDRAVEYIRGHEYHHNSS